MGLNLVYMLTSPTVEASVGAVVGLRRFEISAKGIPHRSIPHRVALGLSISNSTADQELVIRLSDIADDNKVVCSPSS